MAAMANDAIRSEALKKCQQRLDLACVLLAFAKCLSLENVSVPKERKIIAEGATANSIVHTPYGKRARMLRGMRLSRLLEVIEHD